MLRALMLVVIFYYFFRFLNVSYVDKYGLKISVLDVGQGDAILVIVNDEKMLIDTGPDYMIDYKLFRSFGLTSCYVDYILITHEHFDHYGGLGRVLSRCEVGHLVLNKPLEKMPKDFINNISAFEMTTIVVGTGDKFKIGDSWVYVIWPPKQISDAENGFASMHDRNPNLNSIVLLVDNDENEILLMGDLEIGSEFSLGKFDSLIDGRLELLKFPHHGSVNGLNSSLFSALRPAHTAISVGDNNIYGHPSITTIDFLKKIDSRVFQTRALGDIDFVFK